MAGPPKVENIVAQGKFGIVEYAVRANGTAEVREWLELQPVGVQSSFDQLFERLVNHGAHFPNPEQFKRIKGTNDVWEFKRGGKLGNRIFCVQFQNRWLLTHPYKKGHSKKHQQQAATRAIQIAREHLAQ
jgi:hypothetical protein